MIQLGSTGNYVKAWQRIVDPDFFLKADGNFGPKTEAQVKVWQASRGVEPDGIIGQASRDAVQIADLIKPYEGFRSRAYDDHDSKNLHVDAARVWRRPDGSKCIGYPTIGWGRRLWPGEYIETCTKEDADGWLLARLRQVEIPAVNRYLVGDAAAKAAGASQCYNCGEGAFTKLAKANFSEDWWTSHGVTTLGVHNAGLEQRRREEYALYTGA